MNGIALSAVAKHLSLATCGLAAGWIFAGVLWTAGCTTSRAHETPAALSPANGAPSVSQTAPETPEEIVHAGDEDRAPTPLEETWGIRLVGLRRSAGGYMLDFRFRVVDPDKAAPLLDRKAKPLLIDQASGATMAVPSPPKIGPLRTTNAPEAGRNYFILFANPGRYIKGGSKVTVAIGDFRAEDLTVE